MNEPCMLQVPECGPILLEWMKEMAAYMKTLDPNHLVTSGGEGFFGPDSPRAGSNPQVPSNPTSCATSLTLWGRITPR